jgi:putative tryptophan/tyrosine transport system substrate-binding protein
MRRREFISLIGGAAAWPFVSRAQPAPLPTVGFISTRSPGDTMHLMGPFRQGLREAGYIEGKNVAIQYRWAEGHYDRLPTMLADLISRQVEVIAAAGGAPGALAAKAATNTVPIVFISGADPVEIGLVASLNRPGGNLTGVSLLNNEVFPKLAELLHEVLPRAVTVGCLMNPTNPYTKKLLEDVRVAARGFGQQIHVLTVVREADFEPAFATLVELRSDALLVQGDPFINSHAEQVVALATRHALPTIYPFSEYAAAGGLMSYGPSLSDAYRLIGLYSGRILKGERPADLPVQQSTKVELVINLKAAKAIGISIPLPLLGRADEVIE